MNTQAPKPGATPPKNNKKARFRQYQLILAFTLIIIAGLIVWLFVTKTDLNDLRVEKETQRMELQAELDTLMVEHEQVKVEYGDLTDSLSVKDSIIQANAVEIRKLLNTQWEYYKIKKKLAQLQDISQGYVRQIDSLYMVNDSLTTANIALREDLGLVRLERDAITRDKEALAEQVDIASILQAYNLTAQGMRSRGSNKEKVTDKAKRVDKVKVCFTIGKNEIVEAGEKNLYIRIAKPDEEVLVKDRTDQYTFIFNGEPIQYSITKIISYQNEPMDMCLYWYKRYQGLPMMIGIYHVDVFIDGNNIGHTTLSLR